MIFKKYLHQSFENAGLIHLKEASLGGNMELMNKIGKLCSGDILLLFTNKFIQIPISEYMKDPDLLGWKKLQLLFF